MRKLAQTRLALDRRSSRTLTRDGHLHIGSNLLGRAGISQYAGSEVPNWRSLGLNPNRLYSLYRPADELRKALPSLRGKPLLLEHAETSAEDHRHDLVCGAIGSDVTFANDEIRGSLSLWTQDAIEGVESGETRSLSLGYFYRPCVEAGTYRGEPYSLVMRDIEYNHAALCAVPRIEGAMVGDSKRRISMDDNGKYASLMSFLQDRLSPEDLNAVDSYLTAIEDPDDANTPARPSTGLLSASDRQRRAAMDSLRLAYSPANQKRLAEMFPNMNRLQNR